MNLSFRNISAIVILTLGCQFLAFGFAAENASPDTAADDNFAGNRMPGILHAPSEFPVGDQADLYVGIGEEAVDSAP